MSYKLNMGIAVSLMRARWRQSMVAAIGVTFSITMFVSLLGFMAGLNILLDGLILNRYPHVRLYNEIRPNAQQPVLISQQYRDFYPMIRSVKPVNSREDIYQSQAVMQVLREDPRVRGISPKLSTPVFFQEGSIDINGNLNGIDPVKEAELFHFTDYIIEGNYTDLRDIPNSIILGNALAEKLLVEPGDQIQIMTVNGNRFVLNVVGLYQSGMIDYDKTQGFASLATVQKIMGKPGSYLTELHLKLVDLEQAPELARQYGAQFATQAEDIQTANSQFETGSSVRTIISYAVGITLLVVAGFGIYNILNMMIYEKMDSIAILKATGFSGKDINSIFLFIALSIGIIGGIAGLVCGLLLSWVIDHIPFDTAALPTIKTYPVDYNPVYYIIGILFSVITTYFAGLFPARKASAVDPVSIIRGK